MATNKTPSPRILSPEIPVVSYPTPNVEDLMVVQDVDTRVPGYVALEYGDPHPDQVLYPGLKLVFQTPLDQENNHMWVRRIYAKDRQGEDSYNYALKYSASDPAYPIYIRTYTVLRSEYSPLEAGAADPVFPTARLISEEVQRLKGDAEEGSLDSLYVRVVRVYETLPGPTITRYETNEVGQKVQVTEQRNFYGDGYVSPNPSATTSFTSEVGEGNVITDTVKVIPEVFSAKSYSTDAPDPAPVKFRIASPAITEEETVTGDATQPTLSTGEFAKSEAQQTKFTKRKSKTSRSTSGLPKNLVQKKTTKVKQVATVTETLQVGDTNETPSATVDIDSEALGDGTYVVTKTQVPSVFNAKTEQKTRPDVLPTRFTAKLPTKTAAEVLPSADASVASLASDEFSVEKQRVSEFEVRKSTVSRDDTSLPVLSGSELAEEFNVQIPYSEEISGSGTASGASEVTPLSEDTFLVKTYDTESLEEILGEYYESYPSRMNLNLPKILKSINVKWDSREETGEQFYNMAVDGSFSEITIQDTGSCTASISATPQFDIEYEDIDGTNIFANTHLFFLKSPVTLSDILNKCGASESWPVFQTKSYNLTAKGASVQAKVDALASLRIIANPGGRVYTKTSEYTTSRAIDNILISIPPCIHGDIRLDPNAPKVNNVWPNKRVLSAIPTVDIDVPVLAPGVGAVPTVADLPAYSEMTDPAQWLGVILLVIATNTYYKWEQNSGVGNPYHWVVTSAPSNTPFHFTVDDTFQWPSGRRVGTKVAETVSVDIDLKSTKLSDIPRTGTYLIDSNIEPFKHGFFLVRAVTVDAAQFATT